MNAVRCALAYFLVMTIILTLIAGLHPLIALILIVWGVWCLIICDQHSDACHLRKSRQ